MKVRLFNGPDLASAVGAGRRAVGADALIIETRHVDKGVEILAALEADGREVEPLELPLIADAYLDERRRKLTWHGVSEELAARLTERDLAQALSRRVAFGGLAQARHGPPFFFAGQPGAGKTLSLVKVATRLVLSGETPLVISTDGQKAGATEQLAAMTRVLGLTLVVADQVGTLRRALAMRAGGAPVLIDGAGTAGQGQADDEARSALVDAAEAELILVVPAGLDPAETVDIASYHAAMGAKRMIATRLDVARRIGGIIEAAWRSRLLLTEAGVGPGVVDGLEPLTATVLAGRLDETARAAPRQKTQRSNHEGVRHGAT